MFYLIFELLIVRILHCIRYVILSIHAKNTFTSSKFSGQDSTAIMARGRANKRKHDDKSTEAGVRPDLPGPALKKQKREEDRKDGELPRKKFYRQRAHANPFSDHALI